MATLNLNDKLYDLNKLSSEAKAKLESARFCEKKIAELEAEIAIMKTARSAYLSVLPNLVNDDALLKNDEASEKSSQASLTEESDSTKH